VGPQRLETLSVTAPSPVGMRPRPASRVLDTAHFRIALDPRAGAIIALVNKTTPMSLQVSIFENPLQTQIVIHRDGQFLFRTEISFRRLYGGVTEQELDLLEIAPGLAAELRASPA
jgi:hypothetical protein